jgi:hypothetical protein
MEAALVSPVGSPEPVSVVDAEKQSELVLDALKAAVAVPGEHRLFRWGKLGGLFPSRLGVSAAAARFVLAEGLLEPVRTEARGRLIVEWVRATPLAIRYLDAHDSPKAVLRELREVIGETRSGVPVWMAQARDEASQLATRFEHFGRELLRRLDALDERVDAAIRRAEVATPKLGEAMLKRVPWSPAVLQYLDSLKANGRDGQASLAELFTAARTHDPAMTLLEFHEGIRALANGGIVQLKPGSGSDIREPEYAVEVGGRMMWWVER